jgi:hypothetical protein
MVSYSHSFPGTETVNRIRTVCPCRILKGYSNVAKGKRCSLNFITLLNNLQASAKSSHLMVFCRCNMQHQASPIARKNGIRMFVKLQLHCFLVLIVSVKCFTVMTPQNQRKSTAVKTTKSFQSQKDRSIMPFSTVIRASTQPLPSLSQKDGLNGIGDKHFRLQNRRKREVRTLLRVGLPSILAGLFAYFVFPFAAITLASSVNSAGALTVLSTDSSQFVQNFLSVSSLLFSILVGQTCKCRINI